MSLPNEIVLIIAQYMSRPFNLLAVCKNQYLLDHIQNTKSIDWKSISGIRDLPESFIGKWKHKLDWDVISGKHKMDPSFAKNFKHLIKWKLITGDQDPDPEFVRKYAHMLRYYHEGSWHTYAKYYLIDQQESMKNICRLPYDMDLYLDYKFDFFTFSVKCSLRKSWRKSWVGWRIRSCGPLYTRICC